MTPEMIEAVAREIVRTHWERPVEQTDEMFVGCTVMVRDVLAALTAAGYEVRPTASGPVMPEVPSEAVYDAIGECVDFPDDDESEEIHHAIRAALIAEQAGHEETTDA